MQCQDLLVQGLSLGMILGGVMHFVCLMKSHAAYGRYADTSTSSVMVPVRLAWFLQELPALLLPLLLLLTTDGNHSIRKHLMLLTFCLHYFQRSCIYSLLTKGRPFAFNIMLSGMVFCSINGFLQAHYLLHCATYQNTWISDGRLLAAKFFGEIVERLGYALATWSLPTCSFAFFTICFIGRRAYHHHRFYNEKFKDFPRSRRSLIPFIF